jgi:hypothetical protein
MVFLIAQQHASAPMTDDQPKQPVIVSRQDLYAQVWSTPMMQLAEQYGVSGNGLAKICRRLVIPVPGRGYWARKQAGQKVSQAPLRNAPDGVPLQARIAPSPPPAPPPRLSTELEEKFAAARELTSVLRVSEKLLRPHPVIAAWLEEHKRRQEEARRDPWRRMSDVQGFSETDRRRHRFLDALFKALERNGFKAKTGERSEVFLEVDRERVEFELKEKYRQVRRPLTDDEKKWGFNPDRPWRQELQPSGMLAFTIRTHLDSALTHAWIDKPDRPIETELPDIVATLLLAGPILIERRRQHQEAEKRRLEAEHRRYEEQQRRQKDDNRWKHFVAYAHRWREAEIARQFLAALEGKLENDGATFDGRPASEWVEWARERLAKYDPLVAGTGAILQDIAKVDAWTYRD